ncbi:hypothetical protein UY3_17779 [Chelonia mydas]|uniref:Uncharacterized protein n=1 Tax=Chelonia mydas TaxID=8469 RepID=M7AZ60_CHEMY|nr:hypothetical protein UY3_17779 [Chelonia mydas]
MAPSLRLLREVQLIVEDLPFDRQKLFAESTDVSLLTLKDSHATVKTLGIYIPANKKKQGRFNNSVLPHTLNLNNVIISATTQRQTRHPQTQEQSSMSQPSTSRQIF